MDYKEKLKLAKEALESGSYDKETIEYIFPEIAESEDERIWKALINGFNTFDKSTLWYNGITIGQILAWLEKQGVKPDGWNDKDEEIRQELIEMIKEDWPGRSDVIAWIEKQKERNTNTHLPSFDEAQGTPIVKQGEQNPAWSEEDETRLNTICGILKGLPLQQNWLKNLKYRVQPQPKQEWNDQAEIARKEAVEQTVDWLTKHAIKYYINSKGFLGTDELVKDYKLTMSIKHEQKD